MIKYSSIYAPNKQINALQYICELLCQRKAEFDKVYLPIKFWNTMPTWDRYFKKSLRQVGKLLKIYDERAIINTINSNKFRGRYSIFTDFAENLIKKEQEKIDLQRRSEYNIIERVDTNQTPRPQRTQKGILQKLAELDQ